jgi:hypothetical protein
MISPFIPHNVHSLDSCIEFIFSNMIATQACLVLLLVIGICSCRPTDSDGSPEEKRARIDPPQCYFSIMRKTEEETAARPDISQVSTTCQGKAIRWVSVTRLFLSFIFICYSFRELQTRTSTNMYGAKNVLELLLARGEGRYDITGVSDEFLEHHVCTGHYQELVTKWSTHYMDGHFHYTRNWQTKTETCSLPHPLLPNVHTPGLKVTQAKLPRLQMTGGAKLKRKYGVHVHPGTRRL